MKKHLQVTVVCITAFFAIESQAVPIVTLDTSVSDLTLGNTFEVDIVVSNLDPFDAVLSFGFDVFADSGLGLISATVGGNFFDDSTFFLTTDVAGSAFPPVNNTALTLATLIFTTTSVGDLGFSIATDPFDFGFSEGLFTLGGTFDLSAEASVQVSESVTTVTEPTSLTLFGLGLAMLFASRRFSTA